jgi:putative endonuclease
MTDHIELGKLGEKMAAEHLDKMGFKILAKNYVFGKAEVDIVAMKDNKIVFVEVKTRESSYLSGPGYTVSTKKQKQIIKAADAYLKEHLLEQESRF